MKTKQATQSSPLSWPPPSVASHVFCHTSPQPDSPASAAEPKLAGEAQRGQLARGRMLDKPPGRGCNSRSIPCVQIGGSDNSIAAANSLTAVAPVQKRWIMQWRPAGICCPTAIRFNIGRASLGITQRPNEWRRQLVPLWSLGGRGSGGSVAWERSNKGAEVRNSSLENLGIKTGVNERRRAPVPGARNINTTRLVQQFGPGLMSRRPC